MAKLTPTIRGKFLVYQRDQHERILTVGTPDWYAWLETASSFAFVSEAGSFTARRERAGHGRGDWYWRAYHKQQGQLLSRYLGKSEALTLERLKAVALSLSQAPATARETALPAFHPLLATKLCMPHPPAHLVPRCHLIERLQRGMDRPLTLIAAPAGFGKTTLLSCTGYFGHLFSTEPFVVGSVTRSLNEWLSNSYTSFLNRDVLYDLAHSAMHLVIRRKHMFAFQMSKEPPVKPMPLWVALIYFGASSAVFRMSIYVLLPFLINVGLLPFWAFLISYGLVLSLLMVASLSFKREGYPLTLKAFSKRFRFKKLSGRACYRQRAARDDTHCPWRTKLACLPLDPRYPKFGRIPGFVMVPYNKANDYVSSLQ